MTKTRKITLFVLYAVLVGALLLYVLFPSDAVRNAIVNRIQRDAPDLQLSIGDLKPKFPLALSMKDVIFSKKETVLFFADRLTLRPGWMSLFTSDKEIIFNAIAYQGNMSGVISSTRKSGSDIFSIKGIFSGLQLDRIPALQEQINIGLSGTASGQLHFDDVSVRETIGSGEVFVTDCVVIPSISMIGLDTLNFNRIDLSFDVEGNKLELQKGDFQGPELSATLSGSIVFETPNDRSVLNLDITVTPQQQLLSKLDNTGSAELFSSLLSEQDDFNLRVTGLLGTPRWAFGASR